MSYQTIKITVYLCACANLKCQHEWQTKNDVLPVRCPKCNLTTWNSDYNPLDTIKNEQVKDNSRVAIKTVKTPITPQQTPTHSNDKDTDLIYDTESFDFGS